ncbi:hypothetical protein MKI84_00415 [Ancylobacter sp. A5.8]|uniref:hypothetical protein n=1 Tax=Ancylobacter gelatini TaxID=2919920 RepID=UPI001F4ED137|nr:hypothetical protein [Ancylobacter gelatini]MCJ8141377.1 hypothetical protein [Ancylobacter gelatini]
MMGKFGRITVSALALMVSFGALDAVSVNSGAARAQVLTAAQIATPPASAEAAVTLLVSLINQATSNGTVSTNGAGVTDAVILLMTTFEGNPAAVGFITSALVQAASGAVAALQGAAFANLKEPILTGVETVITAWTDAGGEAANGPAFEAYRAQVEAMNGYSALVEFRAIATSGAERQISTSKDGLGDEDGAPPTGATVTQSNPLTRVGVPSPSLPPGTVFTFGGFVPGAPVTVTVTGEGAGSASLQ